MDGNARAFRNGRRWRIRCSEIEGKDWNEETVFENAYFDRYSKGLAHREVELPMEHPIFSRKLDMFSSKQGTT